MDHPYDKEINTVCCALNGKKDTVFRVIHRGVLQSEEYTKSEAAWHRLTDLQARWLVRELSR